MSILQTGTLQKWSWTILWFPITTAVLFPHHLPRLLEGNAAQGHSMVLRTLYTHTVNFERLSKLASQQPELHTTVYPDFVPHPSDAPGATSGAGWEGNIQATKWRMEEGDGHKGCTGKESTAACLCVHSAGIKDVHQPPCLVHAVHRAPKQLSGSSCCRGAFLVCSGGFSLRNHKFFTSLASQRFESQRERGSCGPSYEMSAEPWLTASQSGQTAHRKLWRSRRIRSRPRSPQLTLEESGQLWGNHHFTALC